MVFEIVRMASKDGLLGSDIRLLHLDPKERIGYVKRYMRIPNVTDKHIRAFFHLDQKP